MKNIKLLLATTAVLSTGAIVANAFLSPNEHPGYATMDVKAEIIENLNLRQERPLDFGRVDWSGGGEAAVAIIPNADGTSTIDHDGVSFHDGGQSGEICFADLDPSATLTNISISFTDSISGDLGIDIYDENDEQIEQGSVQIREMAQAATPAKQGERCFYIGGELNWVEHAATAFPGGKVYGKADVTVVYMPRD